MLSSTKTCGKANKKKIPRAISTPAFPVEWWGWNFPTFQLPTLLIFLSTSRHSVDIKTERKKLWRFHYKLTGKVAKFFSGWSEVESFCKKNRLFPFSSTSYRNFNFLKWFSFPSLTFISLVSAAVWYQFVRTFPFRHFSMGENEENFIEQFHEKKKSQTFAYVTSISVLSVPRARQIHERKQYFMASRTIFHWFFFYGFFFLLFHSHHLLTILWQQWEIEIRQIKVDNSLSSFTPLLVSISSRMLCTAYHCQNIDSPPHTSFLVMLKSAWFINYQ